MMGILPMEKLVEFAVSCHFGELNVVVLNIVFLLEMVVFASWGFDFTMF